MKLKKRIYYKRVREMTWNETLTYSQSTGVISDPDGAFIAMGWAGWGVGKNNPEMQSEHGVGPLPQGLYTVGTWEDLHLGLGPTVVRLTQIEGKRFGRDGFYIYGPNKRSQHGQIRKSY